MPGRQSHGRPLLSAKGGSGKGNSKRSKSRANTKALNAFAAAQAEVGTQEKRTPRNRQLDADLNDGAPRGKHGRDEDDEDEDEDGDDEDEAPPRKMRRGAQRDREDENDDVEYGSDSSGNSWRMGAVDDDDDSEIDSDEAFGESDNERFEDYRFGGSKKKKKKKSRRDEEDDEGEEDVNDDIDDADGASLGSDAIDLADALDMSLSDDDDPQQGGDQEDDEDEDSDDESEDDTSGDESSDVESDADDAPEGDINAWVSQFGDTKEEEDEAQSAVSKPKISLADLGLTSVKDAELKKSVKLMSKEDRATKKQKLEVPLARRAQAKLDRSAAYDKTNESMGRWLETVKSMRRADSSLVFPLPQHETGLARHDNTEIVPLNQKNAGTELENTIMAIMEESGLSLSTKPKEKAVVLDGDGQAMTKKALNAQKRRERELQSREEARAKRIKKIKSKAYHRVHRKQREREEMREREGMDVDSEEEREAQDRQRAMERMGARHRESKWAKQSNKNGRAAWDDDVRMGVAEMAKRDEELRRRIEGKSQQQGSDDDSDASDDSTGSQIDERVKLLQRLKTIDQEEDSEPKSKLMSMEFMKKAEARRRKANDELIAEIRRDLASGGEERSDSDDRGPDDVGRRIFGQAVNSKSTKKAIKPERKIETGKAGHGQEETNDGTALTFGKHKILSASSQDLDPDTTGNAWSQPSMAGPARKRLGKGLGPNKPVLELDGAEDSLGLSVAKVGTKQPKKRQIGNIAEADDPHSSDDEDRHLPLQIQDQKLLERAFGGLDALEEFQQEKDEIMADDDEKTVETTLPGWGSWVGEGVSNRSQKKRFFTKTEGVKPQDRKDARKSNVIINEKRIKKNDKYLATQLPHQFESRAQYERSMRLPIGPEFLTKESFQDATKPRVLIKQGIIAPISRPTN